MALALFPTATQAAAGILDQAKLGVLYHDVGIFGSNVETGAQVNGELLFISPGIFQIIGAPRPTVGVAVNTAGKTSYAYFDLTWTATLWQNLASSQDAVYVGGFLGGAVHDGNLNETAHGKKALGTRALYHLGVEAGYQITPTYSVEGYFAHLSNAGAGRHNAGLNDIGLRAGFKF